VSVWRGRSIPSAVDGVRTTMLTPTRIIEGTLTLLVHKQPRGQCGQGAAIAFEHFAAPSVGAVSDSRVASGRCGIRSNPDPNDRPDPGETQQGSTHTHTAGEHTHTHLRNAERTRGSQRSAPASVCRARCMVAETAASAWRASVTTSSAVLCVCCVARTRAACCASSACSSASATTCAGAERRQGEA
jgi:hypothetical protein